VTVDKMFIYGSNKAEWQEVLLKEIAAEQLPTVYGGSCKTSQVLYLRVFSRFNYIICLDNAFLWTSFFK